jgi:SAM-dependent methyltransferase
VDRVDAVDISAAMIEEGRSRPGGDQPNLRWINDAIETAPLAGPYALVTAGASLHWMPWQLTLARLAAVLRPGAFLAVVGSDLVDPPWHAAVTAVIARHSRNPDYGDIGARTTVKLAQAGLFEVAGDVTTRPVPYRQPVADYVEHFHSTSSLAREWMPAAEADVFGRAVTGAVRSYAVDGMLEMLVVSHLTWGRPTVLTTAYRSSG